LSFAVDPVLGGNPIIAPVFIPSVLEHVKQHLMLWYTQKMNSYVNGANNGKQSKYEDSKLVPEIDRSMAVAAEHLTLDTQEGFQKFMPVIQQLMEAAKQFKPQPPMDAESNAILQASMAETKRRADRDMADIQLKKAQMEQDVVEQGKKQQFEIAMNAEDNLTEERMKTLQMTVEAARVKAEQEQTAIDLQNAVQRNLGGGHGN
jgi:hypothetical protein